MASFKTSYPILNMKTTDMCIIFDKEIHNKDRDDVKLYQYLYNIIFKIGSKEMSFKSVEQLDQFAIYAATTVYMRCLDPRRGHYEGKGRELKVIKSILNYLHSVLDNLKVDFQQTEFTQIIDPNEYDFINGDKIRENMEHSVKQDYSGAIRVAVEKDIECISSTIKVILKQCPYKNDPLMIKRIYQSCLLTLLNSFTLRNTVIDSMAKRDKKKAVTDFWLISVYHQERQNSTILWGLDESMRDYITLLVNKIRYRFAQNVSSSEKAFEVSGSALKSVLMSEYTTYQNGEEMN